MRIALVLATVLTLCAAGDADAQQPGPQPHPAAPPAQVVAMASGETRVTPDRATLLVAVETRAPTAAKAGADNAVRLRATLDALMKLGLTREQLSTVDYSVSPDYQYDPQGQRPPRVSGYVARNTVRADVRKLDDLGRIIDAALAGGANSMGGVQFTSSRLDEARREALADAVKKARADAEAMAQAAGASLGQLVEVSSQPFQPPRPMMEMAQMRAVANDAAAPTPVNPGEFTVTATVSVRWALR